MSKESFLARKRTNFLIRRARGPFERELSEYGRRSFLALTEDFIAGRLVTISEQVDNLDGYEIQSLGSDKLQELRDRPFIIATNHWRNGPLGVFWNAEVISYLIKEDLGREIQWVIGAGRDEFHWIIERLRLHAFVADHIVGPVHRRVAEDTASIFYENGKNKLATARKIHNGIHTNQVIGIYPEGQTSLSLQEGQPEVGGLLHAVAKRNVPLVCASTWSEDSLLVVNFSEIITPETIQQWGRGEPASQGRLVVDHVMGTLAAGMREELRGVYT